MSSELNIDGLVGPTHHYGGLARGNLASARHRHELSNPRAAALEGLEKMLFLARLGVPQAVLPPQERPDVAFLRRLGFAGTDEAVLAQALEEAPELLSACSSASSMWAANAATVSPATDTNDGRVHVTPANLVSTLHRSLETATTSRVLKSILAGDAFAHHRPLPSTRSLSDEGAANHLRLAPDHGEPGLEIFVHGGDHENGGTDGPRRFLSRQTLDASKSVARLHRLRPEGTLFLRQHPAAIDAGVFHNDVACVAHRNLLLCHEYAFAEGIDALRRVERAYRDLTATPLRLVLVREQALPLAVAVKTYLLNSQIVDRPDGTVVMICPSECQQDSRTAEWLGEFLASGAVQELHFVQVRQSMRNGGGPACLRLRVPLDRSTVEAIPPGVRLTELLAERIRSWIHRHYPDRLSVSDLADPSLLRQSRQALDDLMSVLGLGAVYPFQQD